MVSTFIMVGGYNTKNDILDNSVPYEMPQLPAVGDVIIPNAAIQRLIDQARKDWNMEKYTRLNYVKGITWMDGVPVIRLGTDPKLIVIDCIYGDKPSVAMAVMAVPRKGDLVDIVELSPDCSLYVEDVKFSGPFIYVYLAKQCVAPSVYVVNESLDVNPIQVVEVDVRRVFDDVNVNVNSRVDVDIVRNYDK